MHPFEYVGRLIVLIWIEWPQTRQTKEGPEALPPRSND
jgi:hypothetical protein